jgi:hypothetical protein
MSQARKPLICMKKTLLQFLASQRNGRYGAALGALLALCPHSCPQLRWTARLQFGKFDGWQVKARRGHLLVAQECWLKASWHQP